MTLLKKYEWIFTNFREYGNCLLPYNLIKMYGVKELERYFQTTYHDENIHIRVTKIKEGTKKLNTYILERGKANDE